MKHFIYFMALFFVFSVYSFESTLMKIEWKKYSDKDDMTIYTPLNYQHKSGLVPIRFKAVIKYPIERVLTVLGDNKRKMEWIPSAVEIKNLETRNEKDFIVYYRYDSPWPFKDRDFVLHNKGIIDYQKKSITVVLKSVEHKKDPAKGKYVRGTTYDGYSIISMGKNNTTIVEMGLLNDFGGFIPKWIVNIVTRKWPSQFMENLNSQLAKKDIKINQKYVTILNEVKSSNSEVLGSR